MALSTPPPGPLEVWPMGRRIVRALVRPLERFARVYFVPSAATPNQAYGKVMVMGEVASETDFTELQRLLVQGGVPLTLDMQVTYPEPQ